MSKKSDPVLEPERLFLICLDPSLQPQYNFFYWQPLTKAETIQALKKELEEANKLLKTFRDKGLTEDGIECLSPSAAQASRLLKSGVTLTGIYSQMVGPPKYWTEIFGKQCWGSVTFWCGSGSE
jgi:hypothetical protein